MKKLNSNKKELSPEQREELLRALKARFEKNMNWHKDVEWAQVQAKLEANADKLWSLTGSDSCDDPPNPQESKEPHCGMHLRKIVIGETMMIV